MNRIIITEKDYSENDCFTIQDEARLTHLNQVIKAKEGQSLKLCLLNRSLADAQIIKIEPKKILLKLIRKYSGTDSLINLHLAYARPPTCKKVLEHGTSLGVKSFNFFQSELGEKSYAQSKVFEKEKTHELLCLGLAQSACYYKLPELTHNSQMPLSPHHQKFLLTKNSTQSFKDVKINFDQAIDLAIGSERGWTQNEEEYLLSRGYTPIKICSSVLRVEIATFTALGQLHLLIN